MNLQPPPLDDTSLPLVSVIIVSYNSGRLLLECVRRVLESTVAVEVLISDNGSSDHAIASLHQQMASEPRMHILENGRNLGFGKANNRAVALAHGKFVLFLNPDCMIDADTIQQCLIAMERAPTAGMVGCQMILEDGSYDPNANRPIPTPMRLLRSLIGLSKPGSTMRDFRSHRANSDVEAISGAFMLLPRNFVQQLGGFDERYFLHWEDLDLCVRVRAKKKSILFLDHIAVTHIKGSSSLAEPVTVNWHKHVGLVRFMQKFHFPFVPVALLAVLMLPLWLHFAIQTVRAVMLRRKNSSGIA